MGKLKPKNNTQLKTTHNLKQKQQLEKPHDERFPKSFPSGVWSDCRLNRLCYCHLSR